MPEEFRTLQDTITIHWTEVGTGFLEAHVKEITWNFVTGNHTLALTDAYNGVDVNSATGKNVTVPPNSSVAFPIGTEILVAQYGAGQVTFVEGSGVEIRSSGGKLKLIGQYSAATLVKRATDEWYLFGEITT